MPTAVDADSVSRSGGAYGQQDQAAPTTNSTISSPDKPVLKCEAAQICISPVSSSGPICRICHEGDSKEELRKPCRCSGSMGLVHLGCLEKWLSSSNTDKCEICHYSFQTYRQPMRFVEWIRSPSSPEDLRNLLGDLLCFVLLTPLASVSSYLCFMGAKHYASWTSKWEASGLICLSIILISIYGTWCFITIRYHRRVWLAWRRTHQKVRLLQLRNLARVSEESDDAGIIQDTSSCFSDDNNNTSGSNLDEERQDGAGDRPRDHHGRQRQQQHGATTSPQSVNGAATAMEPPELEMRFLRNEDGGIGTGVYYSPVPVWSDCAL